MSQCICGSFLADTVEEYCPICGEINASYRDPRDERESGESVAWLLEQPPQPPFVTTNREIGEAFFNSDSWKVTPLYK